MKSLIIPVYKNEGSISELLSQLQTMSPNIPQGLEVVFVVDGSPDRSYDRLEKELPQMPFQSQLVLLSRNFGSFPAIRTGLEYAGGDQFAVMAADLQEPPELVIKLFECLEDPSCDVAIGIRRSREDPWMSKMGSFFFWNFYRRFVQSEMPSGGVDIFGCNRKFRDHLLALKESNSSLVGLLFWLGFQRRFVEYDRRARKHGKSAWTLKKKLRYLTDSIFSFTDLPIRVLTFAGMAGIGTSLFFGLVVVLAKLSGQIPVPGYAATVLTITFFAALNSFGLGIVGSYVWRAFENTKSRPEAVVASKKSWVGK